MPDPDYPYFQIAEFHGPALVAGRNCGSDFPVKTVFSHLVEQTYSGPIEDLQVQERIISDDIEIRVESIQIYQKHFDFLSSGMTALLHVSGKGLELLVPQPPRTYLTLKKPFRRNRATRRCHGFCQPQEL